MSLIKRCRECHTALSEGSKTTRLCDEHKILAADYRRYDALREEGYPQYQAKLMSGLADPPEPHNE